VTALCAVRSTSPSSRTGSFAQDLINALTGGGAVHLRAGPGKGMTIAVRWTQDGKSMTYDHALSIQEMKAMRASVQIVVLESITHAVRKMTPNQA